MKYHKRRHMAPFSSASSMAQLTAEHGQAKYAIKKREGSNDCA
jgi:hypothetical protein